MKSQAVKKVTTLSQAQKILTAKMVFLAIFSFFLVRCEILGEISPFAAALTAGLPMPFAAVTCLGSLLGYAAIGITEQHLPYLILLALLLLGKLALKRRKKAISPLILCLTTLLLFLIIPLLVRIPTSAHALILLFCESILATGCAYFTMTASKVLVRPALFASLARIESISCVLMGLLCVISFLPVHLFSLRLGMILAVLALLSAVHLQGITGGAVGGVLIGIALNLYSTDLLTVSIILLLSGFLTGLFADAPKLGKVCIFAFSSFFFLFVFGLTLSMAYHLIEILAGCSLFLALSAKWLPLFVPLSENKKQEKHMKDALVHRLHFAAETIEDLQQSLRQISGKMNYTDTDQSHHCAAQSLHSVCGSCDAKALCPLPQTTERTKRLETILSLCRQTQAPLHEGHLQQYGFSHCVRKKELVTRCLENQQMFLLQEAGRRAIQEAHRLSIDQLTGTVELLSGLGQGIETLSYADPTRAQKVFDLFGELFSPPTAVSCTVNAYERIELSIYTKPHTLWEEEELTQRLAKLLEKHFAPPVTSNLPNQMRICYFEAGNFTVEHHAEQRCHPKQEVCGDSYRAFFDAKGYAYFLLSDGMGSGRRAAIDSNMTCSLFVKLVKAGLGTETILKLINASLQVKSFEESLSTVDLLKIDLYSGQADFFKAGSAPSFVCTKGKCRRITSSSLPVGILQSIQYDHKSLLLQDGDLVVMLSDGMQLSEEEIKALLEEHRHQTCKAIAGYLCKACEAKNNVNPDDLSVLVLRLGAESI